MYILKTFSNFPNLKELLLGEHQFSTVLHFGFQVNDSVYFTSFNKLFNKDSAITKMNSNLLSISIQAAFSLVNAFFGCICNVLCLFATLVCPSTAPFTMYLCNMEHDSLFPIYVSLLNMTVHFVDNNTKKKCLGCLKDQLGVGLTHRTASAVGFSCLYSDTHCTLCWSLTDTEALGKIPVCRYLYTGYYSVWCIYTHLELY